MGFFLPGTGVRLIIPHLEWYQDQAIGWIHRSRDREPIECTDPCPVCAILGKPTKPLWSLRAQPVLGDWWRYLEQSARRLR